MKNAPLSSRTLSCLSERREEKKLSPDERRVSRDVANISCEVCEWRDVCGGVSVCRVCVEGCVCGGVCGGVSVWRVCVWRGECVEGVCGGVHEWSYVEWRGGLDR